MRNCPTTTEPIKNLQCWPACCNGKVCPQNGHDPTFEREKSRQVRDNQHKAAKALEEYNALHTKVQEVRVQNKETHQLNVSQLKTIEKWYQCDGDEPMPQKKNELCLRYNAMKNRGEHPPPPLVPQEDEENNEQNDDNDDA